MPIIDEFRQRLGAPLLAGLLAGAAMFSVPGQSIAAASPSEAEKMVDAVLEHMNVRSRVESVALDWDHSSGGPRYYTAWVDLKDCDGGLIVNLDAMASLQGVSTVGDCQVRGLS